MRSESPFDAQCMVFSGAFYSKKEQKKNVFVKQNVQRKETTFAQRVSKAIWRGFFFYSNWFYYSLTGEPFFLFVRLLAIAFCPCNTVSICFHVIILCVCAHFFLTFCLFSRHDCYIHGIWRVYTLWRTILHLNVYHFTISSVGLIMHCACN